MTATGTTGLPHSEPVPNAADTHDLDAVSPAPSASGLQRALELAELGYQVLPINRRTKAPIISEANGGHGVHDATTDTDVIERLWHTYPEAGIGITGDGVVVFDGDTYKDGFASSEWADLCALLDGAPSQTTPSGGTHLFARVPEGVKATSGNHVLGHGIDRKTGNPDSAGYAVDYGIDLPPVADLPEAPPVACTATTSGVTNPSTTNGTSRHGAVLADLHRAKTPGDVRRVLESETAQDIIRDRGAVGLREIARMLPEPTDGTRVYVVEPHDHAGVTNPDVGEVSWALQGWLPAGQLVLLAGGWKIGKSLAMYQALLDVALGRPAFGLFEAADDTRVQIWQFEMPTHEHDRRVRKLALGIAGETGPEQILEAQAEGRLSAYVKPPFTLDTPEGLATFQECVRRSEARIVLIDSVGAAFTKDGSVSNNCIVRQQVEDAFGSLLEDGVTIVAQTHKRKAHPGGRADGDRDAIIGAQSWAAASGLIYVMDRVGESRLSDFWVEARCLGGWVHGAAETITLHVFDQHGGLTVEPGKPEDDGVERTKGKVAAAAEMAARLVEGTVKLLTRQEVLQALDDDGVAASTAKRALNKAIDRKILRTEKTGRKTYIRLGPRAS